MGDLSFKKKIALDFFERLRTIEVEVHFLVGNHDSKEVINVARKYCSSVEHLKNVQIEESRITLCHYAMLTWDMSHFNSWNLFAHSHCKLSSALLGKQYDVGVDSNGFSPVSFEELREIMKKRPNNFNYISR